MFFSANVIFFTTFVCWWYCFVDISGFLSKCARNDWVFFCKYIRISIKKLCLNNILCCKIVSLFSVFFHRDMFANVWVGVLIWNSKLRARFEIGMFLGVLRRPEKHLASTQFWRSPLYRLSLMDVNKPCLVCVLSKLKVILLIWSNSHFNWWLGMLEITAHSKQYFLYEAIYQDSPRTPLIKKQTNRMWS